MSAFSDHLESELGHATLNGKTYAGGPVYVALFKTDPTDANGGDEFDDSAYLRQRAHKLTVDDAFIEAPTGTFKNAFGLEFPQIADAQAIATHFGIYDAPVAGNLLYHGELEKPRTYDVDDIPRFPATKLAVTLS